MDHLWKHYTLHLNYDLRCQIVRESRRLNILDLSYNYHSTKYTTNINARSVRHRTLQQHDRELGHFVADMLAAKPSAQSPEKATRSNCNPSNSFANTTVANKLRNFPRPKGMNHIIQVCICNVITNMQLHFQSAGVSVLFIHYSMLPIPPSLMWRKGSSL